MYNPLQARDPLGKWVKEHGGASIEDVVAKTSMVDLENMALDDRTPTAVLNNLATTEYGVNLPDLTVGASVLSAEMIASGTAT